MYVQCVAHTSGRFDAEMAPVEVKGKKGIELFSVDEHPRETTFENLLSLKSVFKENGLVSAGNASVRTVVCTAQPENLAGNLIWQIN